MLYLLLWIGCRWTISHSETKGARAGEMVKSVKDLQCKYKSENMSLNPRVAFLVQRLCSATHLGLDGTLMASLMSPCSTPSLSFHSREEELSLRGRENIYPFLGHFLVHVWGRNWQEKNTEMYLKDVWRDQKQPWFNIWNSICTMYYHTLVKKLMENLHIMWSVDTEKQLAKSNTYKHLW